LKSQDHNNDPPHRNSLPEPEFGQRRGRQQFFDLVSTLYIPDDFLAKRDDGPPQERKLF